MIGQSNPATLQDPAPQASNPPAEAQSPHALRLRKRMARMRTQPSLGDYCYFTTRTNLRVFRMMARRLSGGSRVIDLGCGEMPFQPLVPADCDYQGVDRRPPAHVIHDLDRPLPFEAKIADAVLLSEVLEHTPHPMSVLSEAARILRPGGLVFVTTPFAFPVHGKPSDYFRFTEYFYRRLPDELSLELEHLSVSNRVFSTPLLLFGELLLHAPLVPWPLRRCAWWLGNIIALGVEACTGLLPKGGKVGAFLRSNPLGYAMWTGLPEYADYPAQEETPERRRAAKEAGP